MKNNIQIYILSRDRPNYLQEALDSIFSNQHQCSGNIKVEVVVSDNSENDDVELLISDNYIFKTNFKYIRRTPPLSAREHFKVIISETTASYTVMFHDDDILFPNYLNLMVATIFSQKNIVAVGCNAFLFRNNINNIIKKSHSFKNITSFKDEKSFLMQYLVGKGGIAPYSGYVYQTEFLKKIQVSSLYGGKHHDAVLLSNMLNYGEIIWLPDVLMYYRIHSKNDSGVENISDRLSLLRYMFLHGVDRNSQAVILYKYLFWLNWVRQQNKSAYFIIKHWRYRKVLKFLIYRSIINLFTPYFWVVIFSRLK